MLNEYRLTEMTEGPHKGKTWRTERMTKEAADGRNSGLIMVQWVLHESADERLTASTGMRADERTWIG